MKLTRSAESARAACHLETLGRFSFRIEEHDVRSPATQKARALLVYLVLHRDAEIARERLLELFWPDADPDRARDSLRTALYSIRRVVRDAGFEPEEFLFASKAVARFTASANIDVERLTALAQRDDTASRTEAMALYRGDFLEGDYDEWAVVERERLASLYESLLARILSAQPDPDIARRVIARNPYDAEANTTLIEAELGAGRTVAAAKLVTRFRAALDEVGTAPTAEFEERYAHLGDFEQRGSVLPSLPFCGRDIELARLKGIFARGSRDVGSIVIIHGQPGIGKTTLLERSAELAAAAGLRMRLLHCVSGDPRPFGAWGALFEALGLGNFDDFVRTIAGDAPRTLALALSDAFPTASVLFVDDAQYLGGDQLEVFGAFCRLAPAAGHIVVAAARPEGLAAIDRVLGESQRAEIALDMLSPDHVGDALEAAGFEPDATFSQLLFERTRGHPLYIVSLLEMLVKEGFVRRDGRRWGLVRSDFASLALPRSLARSIEVRLRSRGDHAAWVACALALEPAAAPADIEAVLAIEGAVVLDALDDLLALGVLVEPASGPQFVFAHDVIREVSSTLVRRGRRMRMHALFAERLVNVHTGEALLRRANHLAAAEAFLASAESFQASADDAMSVQAFHEACERCDRGVEIAKRSSEHLRSGVISTLYCLKAEICARGIGFGPALAAAEAAVVHARASNDPRLVVRALNASAALLDDLGRPQESLRDATEGYEITATLDDDLLRSKMLARMVRVYQALGRSSEAATLSGEMIATAIRAGAPTTVVVAASVVFRLQVSLWNFAEARGALEVYQTWARRCGLLSETQARIHRAVLHYQLGEFDAAKQTLPSIDEVFRAVEQIALTDVILSAGEMLAAVEWMGALIGAAAQDFGPAFHFSTLAERFPNVSWTQGAIYCMAAAHIDALLERNAPGDGAEAQVVLARIDDRACPPFGSERASHYVPYVLRARVAARLATPQSEELLRGALERAQRDALCAPSDSFRAFGRLGDSAREIGAGQLARRAYTLRDAYVARHMAAASESAGH